MQNPSPSRQETLYIGLLTTFCTIVVVSNLITVKLIQLPFGWDYAIPAGLLTYPLTFLVGDLVTELYGFRMARLMVVFGFLAGLVSHLIVTLAMALPPAEAWVSAHPTLGYSTAADYQYAFASIFGLNGLALFSSLFAYSLSQILDIWLFAWIREQTGERWLWLRNLGSTILSQLVDTAVVNGILLYFGLHLPWSSIVLISLVSYAYKSVVTVVLVPVFYLLVSGGINYLNKERRLRQI